MNSSANNVNYMSCKVSQIIIFAKVSTEFNFIYLDFHNVKFLFVVFLSHDIEVKIFDVTNASFSI